MKPHIFKRRGLWYCRFSEPGKTVTGIGYKPKDAYDDWLLLELKA